MTISVVEIFHSIEGEGVRSGQLCTFVRLAGCNLRCSYCDTTYSFNKANAREMTVEQICDEVDKYHCRQITITGGEPLLCNELRELLKALIDKAYFVNIETNGSLDITCLQRKVYPFMWPNLFFTVDWKCPSSGCNSDMLITNIYNMLPCDVLKFVVGTNDDLEEMLRVITVHKPQGIIYVSPVFGKIQLTDIVDFLKQHNLTDVRLQVQLHKIIWDPNERGV